MTPRIDYFLGEYQSTVNNALEKIRNHHLIERLWARDFTLWKEKPDEIANRLGWLDAPVKTLSRLNDFDAVIAPFGREDITDVVLLGMGGSSLAAEVFHKIFGSATGYPFLHIVDTTDPLFISRLAQKLPWEKTLFIVSSKSGTTLEVIALFKFFYNLAQKKCPGKAGTRFIFITDEGSPLTQTAEKISARHVFLSPPDIGGRYSALSLPGIIPAMIIGVAAEKLLQKTVSHLRELTADGAALGAVLGTLATTGRDKLTFFFPPSWKPLGDWLEQLIAESTGKEGKGILPVPDEPLHEKNLYGHDRVFVVFRKREETNIDTVETATQGNHPLIYVNVEDPYDLGIQMYIWETATAVAAHFLGVNPFDQPDVESTKKHTRNLLAHLDKEPCRLDEKPALIFEQGEIFGDISGRTSAECLDRFLRWGKTGDYIAVQNYLNPIPEMDKAVRYLREVLLRKYTLPTTCGLGPRYLHSTGQLHKGDSGKGLFIQLTQDNDIDAGIPDEIGKEKFTLTFGALKAAQARGDFQALTEKKRRIIRIHFRTRPAVGLSHIAESLERHDFS